MRSASHALRNFKEVRPSNSAGDEPASASVKKASQKRREPEAETNRPRRDNVGQTTQETKPQQRGSTVFLYEKLAAASQACYEEERRDTRFLRFLEQKKTQLQALML